MKPRHLFPASWAIFSLCVSLPANSHTVKVSISETGIYQLTDAELIEMGFDDPAYVRISGSGGRMISESEPLTPGFRHPVQTMRIGEKTFCYLLGTEEMTFKRSTIIGDGGHFVRANRNPYTEEGIYYLTNEEPYDMPASVNEPSSAHARPDKAFDYYYREEDLEMNATKSGRIYWGDRFDNGTDSRKYSFALKRFLPGHMAVMQADFYMHRPKYGNITFSCAGKTMTASADISEELLKPVSPSMLQFIPTAAEEDLTVTFSGSARAAALDFMLVTYSKQSTLMCDGKAERHGYLSEQGKILNAALADPDIMVWDVSDPFEVRNIAHNGNEASWTAQTDLSQIIAFKPDAPQLSISSYAKADDISGNITAWGAEPCDMLIITTSALEDQANSLAELHRRHDGTAVRIALAEDLYEIFSEGKPDVSAYRNAAYHLHKMHGDRFRNILLFGPLTSDIKGKDADAYLIAYQTEEIDMVHGAKNANIYHAILSGDLSAPLTEGKPDVGIGILPCMTEEEAETIISKIRDYLSGARKPRQNDALFIGCPGDDNLHTKQAMECHDQLLKSNAGYISGVLPIDAYPAKDAHRKFMSELAHAPMLTTYFGHGSPEGIAASRGFLTLSDLPEIRNHDLTFLTIAGCRSTDFDRDQRGLAERMTLCSNYGTIGAFIANRDTWAAPNLSLTKELMRQISTRSDLSIGEAVSLALGNNMSDNALSYQLICDPALKLPVPKEGMELSLPSSSAPGSLIPVEGKVDFPSGQCDVSLRLLNPVQHSMNHSSGDPGIDYPPSPTILHNATTLIEDGRFKMMLRIPQNVMPGSSVIISAFASDDVDETRVAAKSLLTAEDNTEPDETPSALPSISLLRYDEEDSNLYFAIDHSASVIRTDLPFDNTLSLRIDGTASDATPHITATSADGLEISGYFPICHLTHGEHSMMLTVKDGYGNKTNAEISFIYPALQPAHLCSDRKVLTDRIIFTTDDGVPDIERRLEFNGTNGVSFVIPMPENRLEWTGLDDTGMRAPRGIYKVNICGSDISRTALRSHSLMIIVTGNDSSVQ